MGYIRLHKDAFLYSSRSLRLIFFNDDCCPFARPGGALGPSLVVVWKVSTLVFV